MTEHVRNNSEERRYELTVDVDIAIPAYEKRGDTVVFVHTVVPPALERHSVGSWLIQGALDDARRNRGHVIAECSFVAAYLERHPDQQDLTV